MIPPVPPPSNPDLVDQLRGDAAMHRHYGREWSAGLLERAAKEIETLRLPDESGIAWQKKAEKRADKIHELRASLGRILSMAVTAGYDFGHSGIEAECRKALEIEEIKPQETITLPDPIGTSMDNPPKTSQFTGGQKHG